MSDAGSADRAKLKTIASGLRFPEGPVAMPDGSVILVEMQRQTLSRVTTRGEVEVVAKLGGGPNGVAVGPDGAFYVCNNGGVKWMERRDLLFPTGVADDYAGGSIQRVDARTGEVTTLYTHCGERRLNAPNDIVFDRQGGFWFTDHGKTRADDQDLGGVYYATADGGHISLAIFPVTEPNGIGLSPDETVLHVAETRTGRIWSFDIARPGVIRPDRTVRVEAGRCICGVGGYQLFDSMAMETGGNVCVATMISGCVSVITPDGALLETVPLPDRFPTNVCFGGEGLSTAFVTLSGTGVLASVPWPRPGLPLNFLN